MSESRPPYGGRAPGIRFPLRAQARSLQRRFLMNRVTPQTPLDDIVELMQRDGYVVMDNALTPRQVAE